MLACTAIGVSLHGSVAAASDAAIAPAELRRIEALIDAVAQSSHLHFIRNGESYDAATAARFLRVKWGYVRDRIPTAEDFVRDVGTKSGSTGSPYRVRNAAGDEKDSANYLSRLLATQTAPVP